MDKVECGLSTLGKPSRLAPFSSLRLFLKLHFPFSPLLPSPGLTPLLLCLQGNILSPIILSDGAPELPVY